MAWHRLDAVAIFRNLRELAADYPMIGEVRGEGLMIGVELVSDRKTKEPAKSQAAAIRGAVVEHMAKMAVAIGRAHFDACHAMAGVLEFVHVGDRFRETRPATTGIVFIGRSEQGLAGNDIDIDAGLLVIEIFAGAGALSLNVMWPGS